MPMEKSQQVFMHTQYECRRRLIPNFRHLASWDTSAWTFKTIYLIGTPSYTFANRADPGQTAVELSDLGLLCLLIEV